MNAAMSEQSDINPALANMRFVFEKHQDADGWKNPICATPDAADRNLLLAAIIWFHGVQPVIIGEVIYSTGYAG
jgi:hypothetical protein